MSGLESCDVCGSAGGVLCRYSHPELRLAAPPPVAALREFHFFGEPGGGVSWPMAAERAASPPETEPECSPPVSATVALGGTAEEFSDWAAAPSGKVEEDGGAAREARVLRYREKKKRRQFGKQIRYESRKAYAETRPRVRGRFARAAAAADRPTVSGVGTGGSVRLGWVAPPGMNRGH